MNREQIEAKVKEIIAEKAGCEISDVNEQTNLEEIGLDSLGRIELVMDIENEFNICVPDDEAETVVTTKDLVAIVEKHQTK